MTCGIYKITSPTGRVYIGQSVNIERRFSEYRRPDGPKKQRRLCCSFRAHGVEAHAFEVLEECHESELTARERCWQEALDSAGAQGLNCCVVAEGSRSGLYCDESRARMRERQGGKNNPNYGKRGPQTSCWGRKRPQHEIDAIREFQKTRGRIVQQIDRKTGVVLREAKTRELVAEGMSSGNISSCCTGRLKTYKGFVFLYKEYAPCNT